MRPCVIHIKRVFLDKSVGNNDFIKKVADKEVLSEDKNKILMVFILL